MGGEMSMGSSMSLSSISYIEGSFGRGVRLSLISFVDEACIVLIRCSRLIHFNFGISVFSSFIFQT